MKGAQFSHPTIMIRNDQEAILGATGWQVNIKVHATKQGKYNHD